MEEILLYNWANCTFTVFAVGRHAVRACPPITSPVSHHKPRSTILGT